MIFDQEKVEQGILVPNAIKCPRFTGSMLTFKLGRLLEKAQRVYWTEKARRKNQETMWDLPPPLIMEEDEDEQEDEYIGLERHLFSSPLSSCSDENREPEFSQMEQQEIDLVGEVSVSKNRSTNRSVQCQTSLSHFDDNPDETSNENTCTSDDSSSSPKEVEESEEWENLCAAVDSVLSKANLVKPISIATPQVQRPSALKKKKQRKRAAEIRQQKELTVKQDGTSVVQVKPGGYTDPKIDCLFDALSTFATKSSALPEFGVVVPLNEIIEPPLPPVSKSLGEGQESVHPSSSPIAEPVSPDPLSDLPRVSRGLELNNVPSFVGSLLPSKMGIILNRAHQAFAQREKLKQMKLTEAKLPELIPISDDESPDSACTSYNNFSSGSLQPYDQCEFRTIISLDADEYATKSYIGAADLIVKDPNFIENFPRQPEAVPPVEQNIQLNGLKFDPKSIERILNMVQGSGIIDEKPLHSVSNNSSISKSRSKRKQSRKSKHFEVVHLDVSDPSCFKSPVKPPTVIPEMPKVYMPPVELIPLPETPPTRTQNLYRFPSREFFPLPSNNIMNERCGTDSITEFKSEVLRNMSGAFDQRIPSGGISIENIPKFSSTLLSTKIGLVFEKAGKAFRIENTRQRNVLVEDESIIIYHKPPDLLNGCKPGPLQENLKKVEIPMDTGQLIATKKMRLASFYGATHL